MEINKVYEPQRFEPHWAEWWVDQHIFRVEARPIEPGQPREPYFSLAIPPPNVTGSLHMGHMFEHSIIDAQIRWRRMRRTPEGKMVNTLWLPGTDHAGIATQIMVERQLAEEGLTKRDLGREKFEERVWKWKEQNGGRIVEQMKRAGVSCDWSREHFTLDAALSRAVREAFVRLYEKGLIYQGDYIVNWCPRCQTALSDLEVEHEEIEGSLWHIRYPVVDSDEFIVVATTRPETMLGDTAVAINPEDPRAARLHLKSVKLPLTDREIPIVLDEMADLEFGSGAVKITPAHDPNDFEAGKRHDLPMIQVIREDAKMTAAAGPKYAGLDRYAARKQVVADLEAQGLLAKIEKHKLNVGKCHRCKTVVEPLVSKQWWMKMKPLAAPAIKAVEDGRITFVPANWSKTYFEWMYNIRDWCISRQLWWGHRIPAWYCGDCKAVTVARETPAQCSKCGSAKLTQETDVLDTWFSSGLWPFSTLGWPDRTPDLAAFYPTSLLVTGFDIIFFWAARMIMFGLEMMGDVPFDKIHIHGLVRDAERQKMSKTKGNVIDPLVVNDKYGTDAVRFGLLVAAAPGNDIALSEEVILRGRNFANKIWNASKLLFGKDKGEPECGSLADRWIGSRLNVAIQKANDAFENHRYHEAADAWWTFFWDEFCDWYLELKKQDTDWSFAYQMHEKALLGLHPLMPFITEELWHRHGHETSIALEAYPQADTALDDPAAKRAMDMLKQAAGLIRGSRSDNKIDRKRVLEGRIGPGHGMERGGAIPHWRELAQDVKAVEKFENVALEIANEARLEAFNVPAGFMHVSFQLSYVDATGKTVYPCIIDLAIPTPEVDSGESHARLRKDNAQLENVIANYKRQLEDEISVSKKPAQLVQAMRTKLAEYEAQLAKNKAALGE
ncbi:MAG TPA: valine--tRNA ligase [Bryobacteraceae bacterium]|nr:valine--tRNA ligase [Bryobacteraceae bacterium]